MLKEFKEFAFKGNVIDLAVGVIIGGAFGKIVTSLMTSSTRSGSTMYSSLGTVSKFSR